MRHMILLAIAALLLTAEVEKVTPETSQAMARRLAVVSAQMRLQRARAEYAEAQAVIKAAIETVDRENAALDRLLKSAPGYVPGARFDDTGALVLPTPEVKK